jgi:hypothetical protein
VNVATTTAVLTTRETRASFLPKLIYPAVLLASLSMWFFALRAPLWLDETLSYWQVSGGFSRIWERSAQMPSSIGYLYTLWLAKSILGASEIALKIPSLLAALGALYFLYRAARELFDQETAFLATIFFCLENNVLFAATDARPYAFALLATNVAIFAFARWMSTHETRNAVFFGVAAAAILYFHYLFSVILPAFAIYYLATRWRFLKEDAQQLAAVLATFALAVMPLAFRIASLYHSRTTHVVQPMKHSFLTALNTLVPMQLLIGFVLAAFLAGLVRKIRLPDQSGLPSVLLSILLAVVPAGVLFGVSEIAQVHFVIPRYFSVVAPGSALMWAMLTRHIDSRLLRVLFCVALVSATLMESIRSPLSRHHELSFKHAHEFINDNVSQDRAPVLVCSAFIESDYEPMPTDLKSENALLSQVDYYPIHAPVTMLPMDLDDQTMQLASQAVSAAALRHQRFLIVAPPTSYPTVKWLANYASGPFTARIVGEFDAILIVEFRPASSVD